MRKILLFFLLFTISHISAQIKFNVDLIIHQADIRTESDSLKTAEAMAIYRGKIFALGNNAEIMAKFKAPKVINLNGQTIVPGYINVYSSFLGFEIPESSQEAIKNSISTENSFQRLSVSAVKLNGSNKEKERIEVGRFADFIVLNRDIDKATVNELSEIRISETYLNGEKMY